MTERERPMKEFVRIEDIAEALRGIERWCRDLRGLLLEMDTGTVVTTYAMSGDLSGGTRPPYRDGCPPPFDDGKSAPKKEKKKKDKDDGKKKEKKKDKKGKKKKKPTTDEDN